ncbi:MAG: hypothetical protein Q4D21_04040 [Phascolarctobacterium sp.]|nr:hypothetical protein [Phascolarctobacterium sp.]
MELNDKKFIAAKNPSDFTAECCKAFYDYAFKQNLIKGDIAFVPELVELGEKAVLELLGNQTFQKEYGDNPMLFYYMVLQYALKTGILIGARWELNFDSLTPDSYKEETAHALNGETEKLLSELGLDSDEKHDGFFVGLHKKWYELTMPYTQLEDQRYYISGSLYASFQLGVTIILDNLED